MPYTTEVIRRIYNDTQGAYIEIGPDLDGLGSLEIRSGANKASEDYFGKFRFAVGSKELCRSLIDALNASINQIDDGEI